jgi:RNA polymerase sigma-70 factor (ECF subfamily)
MRSTSRSSTSDAGLLAATAAGDTEAFGLIYQRHRDALWAAAARITGPQDADDALQDAMIKAFLQADQFKGNSAVSTWLHRIVINAAHDLVRRRRPTADLGSHPEPSYLPSCIRQADQRMDIAKYWPRLNRNQQLAVALLDLLDLPVAEAAQVLGVSEGTVKVRAARGRHILARYIPRQVAALKPSGGQLATDLQDCPVDHPPTEVVPGQVAGQLGPPCCGRLHGPDLAAFVVEEDRMLALPASLSHEADPYSITSRLVSGKVRLAGRFCFRTRLRTPLN